MKSYIFFIFFGILIACVSPKPTILADKPVYKCTISGTTCLFSNIVTNSTHNEWILTSDDSDLVKTVKFSGSTLTVLWKGICEEFKFLNELNLNGQKIEKINEDAFQACSGLTTINLGDNLIEKLHPATFSYTKNVQKLDLRDNKIKALNDYNIFSNMQSLNILYLNRNNLTEFSPELVRYNKNLQILWLYSNDLSELDAEQIVEFLPNLQAIYMDDNEFSCTRLVQIYYMLESKKISFSVPWSSKIRYYTQQLIFGNLKCNPDAAWMASNYRKENSKIDQNLKVIHKKMSNVDSELTKISENELEMKNEMDQRLTKIEEKLSDLVGMEKKLEKLIDFMSHYK